MKTISSGAPQPDRHLLQQVRAEIASKGINPLLVRLELLDHQSLRLLLQALRHQPRQRPRFPGMPF